MRSKMTIQARLIDILRVLVTGDGVKLFRGLAGGVRKLYDRLARWRSQGVYEVLDHDTTLELMDPDGKVAIVTRRQRVKFMQDNVVAIADHAWGDGDIFAEYSCRPGVPVDLYERGSRHTVLISLRETRSRGDVLRFRIRRKIVGGFTEANEWWETEIYHRTKRMRIAVIFPQGRRCQRATLTQRSTNRTVPLGPQHFRFIEDGRQKLTWETRRPKLHDRYTIRWRW